MEINGKVEAIGERKIVYESKESVVRLSFSIISKMADSNGAVPSLILNIDITDVDEDRAVSEEDYDGYKKSVLRSFLTKYDGYDMPSLTANEVKTIATQAELWFYSNVSAVKSKLKIQELYSLRTQNTRLIHQPRNNTAITTEVISKYEITLS